MRQAQKKMASQLQRWRDRFRGDAQPPRKRLLVEALEQRLLLSGGLSASAAQVAAGLDTSRITGVTVITTIDDSGRRYTQVFQKAGLTIYNVMPSSSSNGLWDVRGDQFCSQWPPSENWSCYDVTGDGKALTFIASDGKLWPVKVLQ